ncbi:MAG: holo-ACP synthase [Gemmataceae bacterium]
MEILGVGTDIVECLRVGRMIEQHGELFLTQIYTEAEIRFCQARRRAIEHFAARWAAKEAVFLAMNRPWRRGMEWTDLEISVDPEGITQVRLGGATREYAINHRISRILLSMAHCRAYATAHALAIRD